MMVAVVVGVCVCVAGSYDTYPCARLCLADTIRACARAPTRVVLASSYLLFPRSSCDSLEHVFKHRRRFRFRFFFTRQANLPTVVFVYLAPPVESEEGMKLSSAALCATRKEVFSPVFFFSQGMKRIKKIMKTI